jgi:hypothetical protein
MKAWSIALVALSIFCAREASARMTIMDAAKTALGLAK